jgi:hypothetical protein
VTAGNFFVDPLPQGDLFALGRILHDWPEDKIAALLARIYSTLPNGGALLVAEKLLLDDATGPSWAQMQDGEVSGCRTSAPLDAILAVKRGA